MSTTVKAGLITVLVFTVLLSIVMTYNRYVIDADFEYEVKPLSEFTEEDL